MTLVSIDYFGANEVHTIDMQMSERILKRGQARRRLRAEPAFARYVRERAGLTQAEMAKLVNRDRSAVSRWERGLRNPRADNRVRYSKLLAELKEVANA